MEDKKREEYFEQDVNGDMMDEKFPRVFRKHSYEEFAKRLDEMSPEDLRKFLEHKPHGDHDYTSVGMDYFDNPNIDKMTAYTDEYGFRLGSFIDDKDNSKGRGR